MKLTNEQIAAHRETQEIGAAILRAFMTKAVKINRERLDDVRKDRELSSTMGMPRLDDDDAVYDGWFIELGDVIVPSSWGDDVATLPIDVLTGDLDPQTYVNQIWDDYYAKQDEYKAKKRESDVNQMRRLMERYPDAVGEILR